MLSCQFLEGDAFPLQQIGSLSQAPQHNPSMVLEWAPASQSHSFYNPPKRVNINLKLVYSLNQFLTSALPSWNSLGPGKKVSVSQSLLFFVRAKNSPCIKHEGLETVGMNKKYILFHCKHKLTVVLIDWLIDLLTDL